ncbi:hypothetical protein PENCOP_c013G05707 [Penicillium coprophilum]|uniref:Uncharacterized protein n=1 Tax=Penicillium coprophilum TaxID=36646 RepID=A0A1V6UA68_9EURO|nr:hypothetical protein PENCOP_c013G05707 [Penicillium coprophilum]
MVSWISGPDHRLPALPQSPLPQTSHPSSHDVSPQTQVTESPEATNGDIAKGVKSKAAATETGSKTHDPTGDTLAPSHTTDIAGNVPADESSINEIAKPANEKLHEPVNGPASPPLVGPVSGRTPSFHLLPQKPPSPERELFSHYNVQPRNFLKRPAFDIPMRPIAGFAPINHPLPPKPPTPERRRTYDDEFQPRNQPAHSVVGKSPPAAEQLSSNPDCKRKRPSTTEQPADNPPAKRRKKSKLKRQNRFSWELGHEFTGHVFHTNDQVTWEFANKILRLPVPPTVSKRLVYFCDASIRCLCGAAGIVWPKSLASRKWMGMGIYYPTSVDNTATVELFAIACTLELAISEIDKQKATVPQNLPSDAEFFRQHLSQTRSHAHTMTKEVFVFTDDCYALRRIAGILEYPPNGDMATELEAIAKHSQKLNELGVHIELHLSPGHSRIPGNVAADTMAKKTQRQLVMETAITWPKAQ